MKTRLLSACFITLTFLLLSATTYAQRDAGGSSGGGTADGGTTGGGTSTPDLTINLGSTVIEIEASSPYYNLVTTLLTYFHATITNGIVTFPSSTCYKGSVQCLYYSGCINYGTYQSCKNPPSSCHY